LAPKAEEETDQIRTTVQHFSLGTGGGGNGGKKGIKKKKEEGPRHARLRRSRDVNTHSYCGGRSTGVGHDLRTTKEGFRGNTFEARLEEGGGKRSSRKNRERNNTEGKRRDIEKTSLSNIRREGHRGIRKLWGMRSCR